MLKKLLKGFLEFWGGSGESSWSLYQLQQNLAKYNKMRQYPYLSYWPQSLYFSTHFWQETKSIYELTLKDEHERKISIFYADGEIVITKNLRGERSRVIDLGQKVSVRYTPQRGSKYYTKEVLVNSQVYSSQSVYYADIPRQIEVNYLFNIHTHPPHYYNGTGSAEDRYYSFFSLTDIKSFINSPAAITGMISDRLWIIAKSATSPKSIAEYNESDITPENLYHDFAFAVYHGRFGSGKVSRVWPE